MASRERAERWCNDSDCVRFTLAASTLAVVTLLLFVAILVPGDDAALITGLLAALSAVLAWYFGSQGTAAAQRQASDAMAEKSRVVGYAGEMREAIGRFLADASDYRRISEEAARDPELRRRLEAILGRTEVEG